MAQQEFEQLELLVREVDLPAADEGLLFPDVQAQAPAQSGRSGAASRSRASVRRSTARMRAVSSAKLKA